VLKRVLSAEIAIAAQKRFPERRILVAAWFLYLAVLDRCVTESADLSYRSSPAELSDGSIDYYWVPAMPRLLGQRL
jgi:hypothetical protein